MTSERERAGEVLAALPKGLYLIRCDDGSTVRVSLGGTARSTTVKIIPGDRVLIEIAQLDPSRGKIKAKKK